MKTLLILLLAGSIFAQSKGIYTKTWLANKDKTVVIMKVEVVGNDTIAKYHYFPYDSVSHSFKYHNTMAYPHFKFSRMKR